MYSFQTFIPEDRLFAPESVFTTHTQVTGETSNFFYTNKEMGIPVHDDTFVSAFYVNILFSFSFS